MAAFLAAHLSKPVQNWFEVCCDSESSFAADWFAVVLLVLFSNFSAAKKTTFYAAVCVYTVHTIHN